MKNKYLKEFIKSRSFANPYGHTPKAVCETQERADQLFYELGTLLAHEILWEDGEATEAEVKVKETLYINVINELLGNGWKVQGKALNETDFFYCMDRKIEV